LLRKQKELMGDPDPMTRCMAADAALRRIDEIRGQKVEIEITTTWEGEGTDENGGEEGG
jgi:hypothetical protein